nr:retrovirus-related Pol polyprotein from transposon TNT 1-94 [Tanacetum cinerariifolium]
MQIVGGNSGNHFRQYVGQNVWNLNGYNAIQNVRNQVVQNAVQNPRVPNVGNQNGLIVIPGIANQNPNGNGNLVAPRAEGNATGHNGNQIRCYNCRGLGHFSRNCTVRPRRRDVAYLQTQLLIAQKEEAGIQLQAEEFDLMTAAVDLDEIEEVDASCILMANLQQASTSGTQTDKAPVYDSDGSAEVHNYENCYDNEIFNMFTQEEQYIELLEPISKPHQVPQNDNNVISEVSRVEQNGGTVEQHSANVKETCVLYDSLYNNLAIEVEKVNTVNRKLSETNAELTTELARYENQEKCFEISQEKYDKLERCYQKSVYQEQCLSKKIIGLHLSFGKQIMTLNEEILDLNKQLSMEKSIVSFLLKEKKKLKSDFKIRKDELLDKQIQLEKKIKESDNILVKTGQSIQTIHMLSPKPDSFYHTERKMALEFSDDSTPSVARKFLYEVKSTIVTLQRVVKQKMNLDTHNWSSSAHQELHNFLKDEFFPIVIQVDTIVQNFEIQFLKEAAKFVRDFKSLAKEADESLAKHKALELEIERLLRAVVSQDIMFVVQNNSVGDTSNLYTELERTKERFENYIIKKENKYAKLWNDWYKKCEECKFDKISYDKAYNDMQQKIKRLQAQLGYLKGKSKDTSCVSDTLNPLSQKLKNENDTSRGTSTNTKFAKLSILGKPPSSSRTKVYGETPLPKSTVLPKVGVDNTAKTRRPQPRSNSKNDRVPSVSKSSYRKNKEAEVEEHPRNLLLFKNKKHMSSKCNNVRLATQNVKSKVVCAMCKQCLISANLDVIQICLWCVESGCSKHMTGNLKLLVNFVWKFLGTVRFENDHIAVILGFGDLQWGNILITRVYFVEGLGHNLFSIGQFCDSNLEVAFRRNECYIKNLEGVDLLKGNRTTSLYTINLHEMASASPICLMARASSTKSWLWNQRLSHLNFDTINDLAKNDLVIGLLKFKYHKEHLCPSCEQGKSIRASHPPKPVPNSRQRLHLLHIDFYGPMRIASINGKRITILLQSPVIIIRTDNGSEFKNQVLKEYFDTVGISHQVSFFRTPPQNGVVERRNRTKTPYELINGRKPDISFLYVFGALCYTKNDREDIRKLGAKGDIGFFIGYSANSCAYRVYNRSMTSGQISSELDLTYAPSTLTNQQPTEGELDLLFKAMYDDYIGGQPSAAPRAVSAAQAHQVRQTSTSSTSIADTAPTPTNSSSQASNFQKDVEWLTT